MPPESFVTVYEPYHSGLLIPEALCLLVLIGQFVGGIGGATIFLILAMVLNFGAWWFSDKIALRMAGAREVSESLLEQAAVGVNDSAIVVVAGIVGLQLNGLGERGYGLGKHVLRGLGDAERVVAVSFFGVRSVGCGMRSIRSRV